MATFTVNPDTLSALHDALSEIPGELQSMGQVVSGYEGQLGGADLDSAVEDFCSHWSYGTDQLAKNMQDVLDSLAAAAKAYSQSERSIARTADRMHQ